MVRSYVFVLFAIALCLAASVYATDDELDNETEAAEDEIDKVEDLAEEALASAKDWLRQANSIKTRVDFYRDSATTALSQAPSLAKGNAQAQLVANDIQKKSKEVIALHPNANKAAETAFQSMQDLVKEANQLSADAVILVDSEPNSPINFTEIYQEIAEVKARVETFKSKMPTKVNILNPASALAQEMSSIAEKIKIGKSHISVILHVSEIDTAIEKAEVDFMKTKQKRDEVNKTLEEMREVSKNSSADLSAYVDKMIGNAETALRTASSAVNDATKAKEYVLNLKTQSDKSLAKFDGEATYDNVKDEFTTVKDYLKQVAKKSVEISNALQLAESTATNAELNKKTFIKGLSPGNTQLGKEQENATNNAKKHLKDGETNPLDNKDAPLSTKNTESNKQAIGQTIEKSSNQQTTEKTKEEEQILNTATKNPQSGLKIHQTTKTSDKTPIGTSENLIQKTADKPSMEKKEQLKIKNSEMVNDKLQKSENKEAKLPLMTENIPALGALGDGSLSVSVPLLAALIVSAVLH